MRELFTAPVSTRFDAYDVTFSVNERNRVLATVENSAGQITHKDVELVDLSGRLTKVPAAIHNVINTPQSSEFQRQLLRSFKSICVARLRWSLGCHGLY
ncbi:MAG: hypothetical protein IJS88_01295 [Alphaproteobacteria bacterium]|nr:hypothetical protein [Alphaproteobacteria bacterium]